MISVQFREWLRTRRDEYVARPMWLEAKYMKPKHEVGCVSFNNNNNKIRYLLGQALY